MSDLGNKKIMASNIKRLLSISGVSQKELCKTLGFKESTFSDWVNAKTYPRIDKIEMMARYFNVSKADLVESNSTTPAPSVPLTPRDERQIAADLEKMLADLDSKQDMAAMGGTVEDEEDRELLKASLQATMRLAKKIAKEKYTPNKYRHDEE